MMNKRALYRHWINAQSKLRQLVKLHRQRRFLILMLGMVCLTLGLTVLPVNAAERVYFNYGPFGFSVSVQSLETFAQVGKVEPELAFILNRFSPEQKTGLRNLLNSQYQFSPVLMAQFFYSSLGERLLTYLGEFVQTQSRQNGFYGIRAALIQATAAPTGLSPIQFMHQFPTNIRLNTGQILRQIKQVSALVKETDAFVATLEQTTAAARATEPSVDLTQLSDLKASGQFSYLQQTKTLQDPVRQRQFRVELYLPESNGSQVPVIVVSNGIGTKLDRYDYLAQHLASHGFAIAVVQHPGSDDQQQQAFLQGLTKDLFKTAAFIDRPLDVTYLLDELERLNPSEFKGQLNLQQVGIFGNSFGGDTALALAGAEIDFEQLKKDCDPRRNLVNLSLLVQCEALELPPKPYNFRDPRIKAASILFPGSSSLFGQEGLSQINIPILWGAVSKDIFSPLLLEQVPAFNALATPEKYLAVTTGIDHLNLNFYALRTLKSMDQVVPENVTVKEPEVVKAYLKSLSLAFFQIYLANKPEYRSYLTDSYAQAISQAPYSLNLVQSLSHIAIPNGL
jgi:predicted dienelactone hydrolase